MPCCRTSRNTTRQRAGRRREPYARKMTPWKRTTSRSYTLDGVFVIVRDEKGDVLDRDGQPPVGGRRGSRLAEGARHRMSLPRARSSSPAKSRSYVYAVPVNPTRGTARVVEAGKSYEAAQEGSGKLGAILAAGIGAAFVLSIGGAYLLARAALRPVEAVTSTAREMGEGDLSKRLPVANPKDEIGRLATTINAPAGAPGGGLHPPRGGPLAPATLRRRREPRAENPPDLHKRPRQDARRVGPRRRQRDGAVGASAPSAGRQGGCAASSSPY